MVSLICSLGLLTITPNSMLASANFPSEPYYQSTEKTIASKLDINLAVVQAIKGVQILADGTYLYGQSSQPGELGKEYLVFQVRHGKVFGAFFMPSSEFSCFQGEFNKNSLDLAIQDSYEGDIYNYAIALESSSPIAGEGKLVINYNLQGYQEIKKIDSSDRQLLNTCLSQL
jgi:hypothetical protein